MSMKELPATQETRLCIDAAKKRFTFGNASVSNNLEDFFSAAGVALKDGLSYFGLKEIVHVDTDATACAKVAVYLKWPIVEVVRAFVASAEAAFSEHKGRVLAFVILGRKVHGDHRNEQDDPIVHPPVETTVKADARRRIETAFHDLHSFRTL